LRLYFGDPANPIFREIVGVVEDVKNFGLRNGSRNAIYFPFAQVAVGNMFVILETVNAPETMAATVRRVIGEIDPSLAAGNVASMTSVVQQSLGPERFNALLFSLFAALAFALAAVGLYGVVSYNVNQRMQEMGVRIALGAAGTDIRRLILLRIVALVGVGIAIGLVGVMALGRLVQGLLFGVGATDPAIFVTGAVLLTAVAVLAGAIPARRAARVDPVSVLKAQ
jgi:putative ABC transport system permease protein